MRRRRPRSFAGLLEDLAAVTSGSVRPIAAATPSRMRRSSGSPTYLRKAELVPVGELIGAHQRFAFLEFLVDALLLSLALDAGLKLLQGKLCHRSVAEHWRGATGVVDWVRTLPGFRPPGCGSG